MAARQIFSVLILIGLGLVGCTAVPDPTPSPQTLAGEGVAVMATRPLATTTLIPPISTPTAIQATETALPISTDLPVPTDAPQPIPTLTPYPTATPLTLPELTWTENITVLKTVNDFPVSWSPVENVFVYNDCPHRSEPPIFPDRFVFLSFAPTFEDSDITPQKFSCYGIANFYWRPDGEEIFFTGISGSDVLFPTEETATVELWRLDETNNTATSTNLAGWYLNFEGWLTNEVFLYSTYTGSNSRYLMLHDLSSGETFATMRAYNPRIKGINSGLVVIEEGSPEYFNSVVVFSTQEIHIERSDGIDDLGPNAHSLSYDGTNNHPTPDFNSSFSDWLPDSNQILVETWDEEIELAEVDWIHDAVVDLQLWDIESNKLFPFVPGGFHGQFSARGQYLFFMFSDNMSLQVQLVDRVAGEAIFTSPVYLETDDWGNILSFNTFSPDGRTLTFYSPTPELMLYDLEMGEFLPPLTAVPYTPLWSPDSSRFVYQHPTDGLSIFDMRSHTTYPLATSGGEQLSNPQWSYDGTYLSVTVQQEDGSRDTAVLQIP